MTPGPGIEPGTHWRKASALTTEPTLLPILVVVCITLHLHFLLKISLVQFFKIMWNERPGTKLVTGVDQICRSNLGGAMWRLSVGTKKSVYFLLEIQSCQLAYFVQFLQYSHELLALCIGLRIQRRFLLITKAQILAEVTEVLAIERGPLSLLTDTNMPSEANVVSIVGITALALVEVTNPTYAYLDCLYTVTSRYSPI